MATVVRQGRGGRFASAERCKDSIGRFMSGQNARSELAPLVNSNHPIVYLETWEEGRAEEILGLVAADLGVPLLNASSKVDFQGWGVTSDGGLILVRELDEHLGFNDLIAQQLIDSRREEHADSAAGPVAAKVIV